MKTAMQELIFHIAYMERKKYQDEQTTLLGGMNECIMNDAIVIQDKVIKELTEEYAEYLEKEKEQIKKAYKDCHDYMHIYGLDLERYFNDEYKN